MQDALQPNHFAHLFGGVVVEEALKTAKSWKLNSRVCHPLDRPSRRRLAADLAKYDASIDAQIDEEATAEAA